MHSSHSLLPFTRREIQYVVLTCINTMAQQRPATFRPFLSDFLVKSTDPVFNRLLKLEILTSICTKENTTTILRELQIYIKHGNSSFVAAVVRAVGRVAGAIFALFFYITPPPPTPPHSHTLFFIFRYSFVAPTHHHILLK